MDTNLPRPNVIKKEYNTFSNPAKDLVWIQIPAMDMRYLHCLEFCYGYDVKFDEGCFYVPEKSLCYEQFKTCAETAHWKLSYNENITRSADKIENYPSFYLGVEGNVEI